MKLYNSLTQTIETFTPSHRKNVTMYVCGITPYDTTHLGHACTYVTFDVLRRYLSSKGYTVTYTQNVTDIDDDILKRAERDHKNWRDLGIYWTNKFLSDMNVLNVLPATHFVKATDSIEQMLHIINSLLIKGFAYERNGTVYFDVKKCPSYGKLSRLTREQMITVSKERGADPSDPAKKDPLDFILWQKAKEKEPYWESPWGEGRPGWHIECSAMAQRYLGDTIDIHGGGSDLKYPHHESEIAQSEKYTGKRPFAKYWIHTAMLLYKGQKMSKSLGNLVMVSDLTPKYSPDAIRFLILSHHYRKPWNFRIEDLDRAEKYMTNIKRAQTTRINGKIEEDLTTIMNECTSYLEDDLDTPHMIRQIRLLADQILKKNDSARAKSQQKALDICLTVLGFNS